MAESLTSAQTQWCKSCCLTVHCTDFFIDCEFIERGGHSYQIEIAKKTQPQDYSRWPVQCRRQPSQRPPYPHSHENMHLTSKMPYKNSFSPSLLTQHRPGISSILMKTHKYEIFTGLFPWESPSLLTFTQFAMDYYHLFHQPSKNTHKSPGLKRS